MFDEHVERSVDEIICSASLLQLGEECKNFSCRYPGHFQRIYRQNLLDKSNCAQAYAASPIEATSS